MPDVDTDPAVMRARPLTYAERGARYLRQRGLVEDEIRMLCDQVTPRQRRRMFHKERRSWRHG